MKQAKRIVAMVLCLLALLALPAGAVMHSETGTMTSMVANGTNENATALGITRLKKHSTRHSTGTEMRTGITVVV